MEHLLGALGRLWGSFCAFKIELFQTWAQDGLQEAFWTNLGWIWEGLGKVLGGLGEVLYCSTAASYLLRVLSVLYWNSFCYRNPRAASLRPAERHNTRGFAEPLRVLDLALVVFS